MLEVTKTVDGRTFVEGTDLKGNSGSCVLQSAMWDEAVNLKLKVAAVDKVDAAIDEILAPLNLVLNEVAEELNEGNDWRTITIRSGVEGESALTVTLPADDHDGVILRLLAETDGSTLRWINNGSELIAIA